MQPKVGEWINEYAIPNKIHPSVIGYILSKYIQSGKSEHISDMGYFYEEPEVGEKRLDQNGCKGRTNDPRGWTSISNTLYAFEEDLRKGKFIGKDVEHMLEVSINSKLREEWARSRRCRPDRGNRDAFPARNSRPPASARARRFSWRRHGLRRQS